MLQRAKSYPAFGGMQSIKAVDPEDVIGLKVQAMFNDPTRWSQEVADIERLATLYGQKLDWDRIEEFYNLFGLGEEGRTLRERFGHAH